MYVQRFLAQMYFNQNDPQYNTCLLYTSDAADE